MELKNLSNILSSGDVWSGQRTKPSEINPNTWGLYFS